MSRQNETANPTRTAMLAFLFAIGLTTAALAETKSVSMKFSDPLVPQGPDKTVTISFTDEDTGQEYLAVPVPIAFGDHQLDKENKILEALDRAGITASSEPGGIVLRNIDSHVKVNFDNGGTAEHDVITCAKPADGWILFENPFFDLFDANNQPAVFTAGIVTDVGELTATITAQDLNFQTEGPIICQALFQRLAPRSSARRSTTSAIASRSFSIRRTPSSSAA